jgi:phosphoribosyl 1,2-cyclic phosphodiesterase
MAFDVTFWGVRGTVPCPSPDYVGYGGNTSCVEVRAGTQTIVLDCGTGLRALGKRLMADGTRRATILLSHFHLDHIGGFPFFEPAFSPDFSFRIRASRGEGGPDPRSVLSSQMSSPLFPVPLCDLKADLVFEDFRPGETFTLGDGREGGDEVRVRTAPLNHPDGASGFRIEHAGRALAYVTDTEHVPGRSDVNVLSLIRGADLVIYDSTYTDEQWAARVGWGHSTWREGIRLCRMAGARRLALFHHDPDHDDVAMARIEREARASWKGSFAAREGMKVAVGEERGTVPAVRAIRG